VLKCVHLFNILLQLLGTSGPLFRSTDLINGAFVSPASCPLNHKFSACECENFIR